MDNHSNLLIQFLKNFHVIKQKFRGLILMSKKLLCYPEQGLLTSSNAETFAILMCTYNGENYLPRQLRSFLKQSNRNWKLYISDDGSSDQTPKIISKFGARLRGNRVTLYHGPRSGFSQNFMSLLSNESIQAQYYALSDQDDIWEPGKLDAALYYFKQTDPKKPALYCGRTIFVDQNDKFIGLSSVPERPLSFQNALVQNIASGNTMVINNAARKLLIVFGAEIDVFFHDWLVYLLVSGTGGDVFYDKNPFVRYRQHPQNQIGMNSRIANKLARIIQLLRGDFKKWNDKNIESLEKFSHIMEHNSIKTLDYFSDARKTQGLKAYSKLVKSGVYRQKYIQNLALYLSAILGKM